LHNLKNFPLPLWERVRVRGKVFIYLMFSPSPLSPTIKGGEQFRSCAEKLSKEAE